MLTPRNPDPSAFANGVKDPFYIAEVAQRDADLLDKAKNPHSWGRVNVPSKRELVLRGPDPDLAEEAVNKKVDNSAVKLEGELSKVVSDLNVAEAHSKVKDKTISEQEELLEQQARTIANLKKRGK